MKETGCCPILKATEWDKKTFNWKNKPFYRTSCLSLFHIPLTMGSAITEAVKILSAKGLMGKDFMCISKEDGLLSTTLLISLKHDAPGLPIERITGQFMSRLFEGDYKDTGKWVSEMMDYVKSKGKTATELLFWYGTCPKCAKVYGKAQTVIFAHVG